MRSEKVVAATCEDQLWSAQRSLEEYALLLNHLGDHVAEANAPTLAATYYQHATGVQAQVELLRQALSQHEQLTAEQIERQANTRDEDGAERPGLR